MPLKMVVDAVEARLAAEGTGCPVFGINLQGDTPEDGSEFVQVSYPVATGSQISIGSPGSNVYREEGTFRLAVHAQRGTGVAEGLAKADQLAAMFRGKILDGAGNIRTYAPSSPAIDDRNEEGMYYTLSVSVPYEADIFG